MKESFGQSGDNVGVGMSVGYTGSVVEVCDGRGEGDGIVMALSVSSTAVAVGVETPIQPTKDIAANTMMLVKALLVTLSK